MRKIVMKNKKHIVVVCATIVLSIISGIISDDLLLGGTILATGILCAYFASETKRINYIFGFINIILIGFVSFKNNLYGTFFFYIFVSSFLQISGFINWNKNMNDIGNVNVREFTLKNSFIISGACIIGSFILGYLLSLIPRQNLAFMDSASNCLNICGIVLMNLRFKECWWIWAVNNIIDVIIWIFMVLNTGVNSIMMLLVSIAYLTINIYGIIKWKFKSKECINRAS